MQYASMLAWFRFEMAGKARPRKPSAGSERNSDDSFVIAARYWPVTFTPPTATTDETHEHTYKDLVGNIGGATIGRLLYAFG